MELRWLKIIDVYKGWDSRWDEETISKYPREPVLQYRESPDEEWKNIPLTEIEERRS